MFATIILVLLIVGSYKFQEYFKPVRSGFMTVMAPMQRGITMLGKNVEHVRNKFASVEELQKENENLRAAYDELKQKYEEKLTDSYELENLRALFNLSQTYNKYETVGANIISRDTSGYSSIFTIDKGEKDGIKPDMNVIAGNGLVGIVSSVGDNYAIIRSIVDNNSYISATILKSSDPCMVNGNLKLMDEGCIEVKEIPLSSNAGNNYQVVTSSQSSKYLPDILIGYITNISIGPDGLTKTGYLIPVVDFTRLDTVLVITTVKESRIEVSEE